MVMLIHVDRFQHILSITRIHQGSPESPMSTLSTGNEIPTLVVRKELALFLFEEP